ncbi:MAG TPA: phosphate ABC transporter permease PstA [Candidatus Nanopelagicaceae bacterium]
MSTVDKVMTTEPRKPWAASKLDRAKTAGIVAAAALISVLVIALTPMSGKLAFAAVFFFAYLIIDFAVSYRKAGRPAAVDGLFRGLVTTAIVIAAIPIVSILATVWIRGHKGLHWTLFTKDMHSNSFTDPVSQGGLVHAIIGTFLLVLFAMIISVPIGILTALYLTEIRGRFTRPIEFLVQAMSGVPSIVAGLFIYAAILVPLTKTVNGIQGSLALAILMIPTVARTSQEVLKLIPQDLREAGVALGGTQWRSVALVVVPAARSGLITAMILGVARVAGETAPILLLTGGSGTKNYNVFSGSLGSLPNYVWQAFAAGTPESITRAWAGILVLLVIVVILFTSARILGSRIVGKK